jgi:peptide chain release factor 1
MSDVSERFDSMALGLRRKLEEMEAALAQINAQLADPEVVVDHRQVTLLSRRRAALEPIVEQFAQWKRTVADAWGCRTLLASPDAELASLAREELPRLDADAAGLVNALQARLVTADDRSVGSVILEVRAGVGGDEAGLWAGDLVQMYSGFAQKHGWKVEPLELSAGDVGGVKSAILSIRGEGVWSMLAFESGTHQVKRVPATETQGRVHTSTATVAVLPEPEEVDLHIDPDEVKEIITTAQGPGGQNVNKLSTAVHLIHLPTGIEVRMQETRSQGQNRMKAWQLLRARLHERRREEAHARRTEQRNSLIGGATRAEKIRTYRYKENVVVDHRLEQSFNLQEVLEGGLDAVTNRLLAREVELRVAAL